MNPSHIPSQVVVFDLEFTAWAGSMTERWLMPGQFREVVQIGAVRLAAASLAETGSYEVLVRPRINPVLSPYFEELTGITNEELSRRGVDFAEALAGFESFVRGFPCWAFGRDDLIFAENFRLYGLKRASLASSYGNIAPWLRANGINPAHAGDVAGAAGVALAGRKHDALYDARSVAEGIRVLAGRGAENPFAKAT